MKKHQEFNVQDTHTNLERINNRMNALKTTSDNQNHAIFERDLRLHHVRDDSQQRLLRLKQGMGELNDQFREFNRAIHAFGVHLKDAARKEHLVQLKQRADDLNYESLERKT